jgi:hypothetical protein
VIGQYIMAPAAVAVTLKTIPSKPMVRSFFSQARRTVRREGSEVLTSPCRVPGRFLLSDSSERLRSESVYKSAGLAQASRSAELTVRDTMRVASSVSPSLWFRA